MFHRLGSRSEGSMSLIMMGVMVVLALVIGGVIDFTSLSNQKRNLQSVADGAAIAAAREMIVAKASNLRVQAVANSYVAANYKGAGAKDAVAWTNRRAPDLRINAL